MLGGRAGPASGGLLAGRGPGLQERRAGVPPRWPPAGRRTADGPWLLVSDRDDGPRLFRRYAKRTWTEELFRDEKSSGFHWGESHVTDPVHAARLVLLMALATYLALAVGSRVIQAGLRRFLESTRQRMLSYFTIGLRWVMFCMTHDRSLPEELVPGPPVEKCRSVSLARGGNCVGLVCPTLAIELSSSPPAKEPSYFPPLRRGG